MARGGLVNALSRLVVEPPGAQRLGQRRHVLGPESGQGQPQPLIDADHHPVGRLPQLVPVAPEHRHGQHRIHGEPPEHEGQGLHRLAVRPLHVIDEHRHRIARLQVPDQAQQLGPHAERRRTRRGPGKQRVPGQRCTIHPAQQLPDDPVVKIGFRRVGSRRQNGKAFRRVQTAPGQGALADARLAFDRDQPGLTRTHPGDHVRKARQFPGAIDEYAGCRLSPALSTGWRGSFQVPAVTPRKSIGSSTVTPRGPRRPPGTRPGPP